jgi:hypothetical protein
MASDERVRKVSRRLRELVEPLAANVYFAPEAFAEYETLGLRYLPGYFCSRSACMGAVPGEVVVAAFGVFNPAIVIPSVEKGWSTTTRDALLAARQRGATASLERILAGVPDGVKRATELLRRAGDAAQTEGHHLYAGLRSLGFPGDPIGDLWRAADLLREHRGDSHVCAWVAHGVDAVEITLLTELFWGLALNSYVATRGWSPDDIAAGIERLESRGLVAGGAFTDAGRELRAAIEDATDRQEADVVDALGDDAEELFALLEPWAQAVLDAGGYPVDPTKLLENRPR